MLVSTECFNLQWFRDQGRGQEAADAINAEQVMYGIWPVAIWRCECRQDAEQKWQRLYAEFAVNAMTYYPKEE